MIRIWVLLLLGSRACAAADLAQVHVLVWDERQPKQSQAYENFLGNEIAERLREQKGFEVRSVALDDPDQGLTSGNLEWRMSSFGEGMYDKTKSPKRMPHESSTTFETANCPSLLCIRHTGQDRSFMQ